MIVTFFFILLAGLLVLVVKSDHYTIPAILVIGVLQDPTRKVMEGEPVYMVTMVGIVVAVAFFRQVFLINQSLVGPFVEWDKSIRNPLNVFLMLIAVQGVHSLFRYQSLTIPALGGIFYIAPLIAIVVGYHLFKQFSNSRRFLVFYCAGTVLVAFSVLVSYSGIHSDLLGEVGSGLLIYDQGTVLRAYSGLMRSSEIAAWHLGAGVCMFVILLVDKASLSSVLATVGLVSIIIGAVVLTGRRKSLVLILVFVSLYLPVLRYYRGRLSERFLIVIVSAILVLSILAWIAPNLQGTEYDLYIARGASVFNDATDRFSNLGIASIGWAINVFGFFGGGLGVAAQGAQHFTQVSTSGAGEGGLGKIVSELGVPALFVVAWLSIAIAVYVHKSIKLIALVRPHQLPIAVGCVVFLAANIPSFVVASQAYGDVFILLLLGLVAASLMALPQQLVISLEQEKALRKALDS